MTARIGTFLLCLAMTSAGCGSSSPAVTAPSTTSVTVTASTEVTSSPTVPQLFASSRGVTADTITIAVVSVDFDALRDIFGTDLNYQDPEPVMKPLLDDLNERGASTVGGSKPSTGSSFRSDRLTPTGSASRSPKMLRCSRCSAGSWGREPKKSICA